MISFFRVPPFPSLEEFQRDPEAARRVVLRGYHVMLWRGRWIAFVSAVCMAFSARLLLNVIHEPVSVFRVVICVLNVWAVGLHARVMYSTWSMERSLSGNICQWESLPKDFIMEP